jgi:protein-disulfide isomerase
VLSGVVSALLPELLLQSYAAKHTPGGDPVKEWAASPRTTFTLQVGRGAFGDYSLGDPNAPIQIVEFADYECPACKMMHEVMKDLLNRYQGKYYFVFKNYPLDKACNPEMERPLHEFACVAAFYSRCAGEQGKFWEANTILFLRDADKGELARESLLSDGSKELGIDEVAARECLDSGRYREVILRDIKDGSAAGLEGTPSVWINGKLVKRPGRETFTRIFDTIISERGVPLH